MTKPLIELVDEYGDLLYNAGVSLADRHHIKRGQEAAALLSEILQRIEAMERTAICLRCNGDGHDPEPVGAVCCGQPVAGAEYMGEVERVCCGSPEPEFGPCRDCQGTGLAAPTVKESLPVESQNAPDVRGEADCVSISKAIANDAADWLREHAVGLKAAHTVNGEWNLQYRCDHNAKLDHDDILRVADALQAATTTQKSLQVAAPKDGAVFNTHFFRPQPALPMPEYHYQQDPSLTAPTAAPVVKQSLTTAPAAQYGGVDDIEAEGAAELEAARAGVSAAQDGEAVAVLRREIGENTWFDWYPVRPGSKAHQEVEQDAGMDCCVVYPASTVEALRAELSSTKLLNQKNKMWSEHYQRELAASQQRVRELEGARGVDDGKLWSLIRDAMSFACCSCGTEKQQHDLLARMDAKAHEYVGKLKALIPPTNLPDGYITIPAEAWSAQMAIEAECIELRERIAAPTPAASAERVADEPTAEILALLKADNALITDAEAAECYQAMLAAAPSAASAGPGWVAVSERLPDNAKPVLCLFERMQRVAMYIGQYTLSTDERSYNGDADYCEATDCNYWPEGWYCYEDGMELWMATTCDPTHWMLLPAAPTEGEKE